jgi:hypothetical protein
MPEEIYEDAMRAYVMHKKWSSKGVEVMAVMEEKVELSAEDMKKVEGLHESATAVDDVSGVTLRSHAIPQLSSCLPHSTPLSPPSLPSLPHPYCSTSCASHMPSWRLHRFPRASLPVSLLLS